MTPKHPLPSDEIGPCCDRCGSALMRRTRQCSNLHCVDGPTPSSSIDYEAAWAGRGGGSAAAMIAAAPGE